MNPASVHQSVTGIVLAGGQSHRMGGGDKGLLDLAGKPMLGHVLDRLAPQVGRLAINANGDPARFARFGLAVFGDTIPGFAGPLAGVLAGMRWCEAHAWTARWIATAPSDVPMLPLDLVARLAEAAASRTDVIVQACSGGVVHPVVALWPVVLAGELEDALGRGVRKVQHWADRHDTLRVDFPAVRVPGTDIDPFFNANTPEDLDALRAMLAKAAT